MPKIRITEVDNTGTALALSGVHMVYIPGATSHTEKSLPKPYATKKELLADVDELGLIDDLSFKMASRLLDLGLPVLYQAFPLNGGVRYTEGTFSTPLISGDDSGESPYEFKVNGTTYTFGSGVDSNKIFWIGEESESGEMESAEVINGEVSIEIEEVGTQVFTFDFVEKKVMYTLKQTSEGASISISKSDWTALEDKNIYDFRFLSTGGYAENVSTYMVTCAAHRGDCVALIDHININPYSVSSVRQIIEALNIPYSGKNADNALSFAAAFTPWFTGSWMEDGVKVETEFPASFGYLLAYARSIQKNPLWKAVAGSFRGRIPELTKVSYELTNAEVEVLQARGKDYEVELDTKGIDNVGMSINPIALEKPYGYLIWGDRTLRNNEGYLVATSSLHSRILVTEINKLLYLSAKKYTFEQNTDVLWINFKSEVNPTLEQMKSGEGIGDYQWKRLATSARGRLKARVSITPIDCAEDFDLEISMEDSIDVAE